MQEPAKPRPGHPALDEGRTVLRTAAASLLRIADQLDSAFEEAALSILRSKGRVVTSGIGKAGHIARKASSTFASTGTDSIFLHPAEALHGDLGRVTAEDVVLLFSNSGQSAELVRLLSPLRGIGAKIVALTSDPASPIAKESDVAIAYGRVEEAGHLGLAPTTSTTVLLALGDALAMAVAGLRQFTPSEFARFHPGGALGRSLMHVGEVMRRGDANPIALDTSRLIDVVHQMSSTPGRPGAISLVDANGELTGFYTDGDFRRQMERALDSADRDFKNRPISEYMSKNPLTISPDRLATEAARILRERRIDQLPVVDATRRPIGLIDVQDLLDILDLKVSG